MSVIDCVMLRSMFTFVVVQVDDSSNLIPHLHTNAQRQTFFPVRYESRQKTLSWRTHRWDIEIRNIAFSPGLW